MNRIRVYGCNAGSRFISTNNIVKSVVETVAVETDGQKEYYKNLDANSKSDTGRSAGWDDAIPYSKIPGPKAYPLVGNIWRFFPYIGNLYDLEVLDLHKKLRKEYGDIVKLSGIPGVKDVIMIFSPDAFEVIHRNEGVFPIRDALKAFAHYRTVVRKDIFQGVGGITTVQGLDWYNFRTKVNPILMQPRTASQYVGNMDEIATDLIGIIRNLTKSSPNGEMPEDFVNYLYRWALESIGFIALDRRLGCLDPNLAPDSQPQKIVNSAIKMFYLYYKIEVMPTLWMMYKTKNFKRFIEVLDTMTFTFLEYIQESLNTTSQNKLKADHQLSVFQRLLKIDKNVAMAMAMDMLTAGVDTTGKTSGAALYYLAKYPEVQNKLRDEILTLLPNKNSPVSKEVLTNATYLKAVIKETTRIAPISVGNFRQTTKDTVLSGYQIPKGINVLSGNLLLCHSDKHFPKAMEFIPERWLRTTESEISYKHTHPFVFLPFGFGPRSCIGKRLANLELEVLLAKIVRNFALEWHQEDMTFVSIPLYGIKSPLKLHFKELDN